MENNNGGSFDQNDQNQRAGSGEQNARGIDQQNMNRVNQQEQQADSGQGNSASNSNNERWSPGQSSGTNTNPQEQQSENNSQGNSGAGGNNNNDRWGSGQSSDNQQNNSQQEQQSAGGTDYRDQDAQRSDMDSDQGDLNDTDRRSDSQV